MNLDHLRALVAIVDEGSFEGAAYVLGVTPSAISQRIKAMETAVGHVVVRRGAPCTPTDAGAALLRMARQIQVIEAETRTLLGSGGNARSVTPVAVNADSLATWFVPVLGEAAGWEDTALDLHVEDQDHSSRLLRQGDVIGAVTSDPTPVSGCRAEMLGHMRYLPVAVPALRDRFSRHGRTDFTRLPVLQFNVKDELQHRFLSGSLVSGDRSPGELPPKHVIPSSEAFLAALKAGLGWGMIPELQLKTELRDGALVLLKEDAHQDVPLYWQMWTLDSDRLNRISDAIRRAGKQHLR